MKKLVPTAARRPAALSLAAVAVSASVLSGVGSATPERHRAREDQAHRRHLPKRTGSFDSLYGEFPG